jgi:hypothetical protein
MSDPMTSEELETEIAAMIEQWLYDKTSPDRLYTEPLAHRIVDRAKTVVVTKAIRKIQAIGGYADACANPNGAGYNRALTDVITALASLLPVTGDAE